MGLLRIPAARTMVIMMMITDCRPHYFVPNKQRDGFPEIPEATFRRLAIAYAFSEATEHKKHKNGGNKLKQHELGQLTPEDFRQQIIQRTVAMGIRHSARNVKPVRITDMVKMISFMFSAH
jgi:hypothetical protein